MLPEFTSTPNLKNSAMTYEFFLGILNLSVWEVEIPLPWLVRIVGTVRRVEWVIQRCSTFWI